MRKEQIRNYLNELQQSGDILTEFDEEIWQATVEQISLHPDKSMTFLFRDGTETLIEPHTAKSKKRR